MEVHKIAIVHLIWVQHDINHFKNFITSYLSYDACYPHHLILLFNGVNNESELDPYFSYLKNIKVQYQYFFMKGGRILKPIHGYQERN